MKKPLCAVSDHAVVRYLERVGGFDIAGLRNAIAERVEYAARAGANSVTIDGFSFVLENDTVITVFPAKHMRQTHHAGGRE